MALFSIGNPVPFQQQIIMPTIHQRPFRVAIRRFDPFEAAIKKQWNSFSQASGCTAKLEVESFDLHPLHETLLEKEGMKRGDWDVALIVTDWLAEADETGALHDLTPYISKNPPDNFPDGWSPSLLQMQDFSGRVLALPYHDGPECLIYRKDIFEKTGAAIPRTWLEFHETARRLHHPEKNLFGTVFAGFPDGHNTLYDFCIQLWTRGGELFDSRGALMLNTPEVREALEYYRMILSDPTAVHPRSHEFDSVQSGLAFARGEVAMMVNWFGFAAMCETLTDSPLRGKVEIAPIPSVIGVASASLNVYWLLAIGAGCKNPGLAYEFIRHCLRPDMDKLLALEGAIGCRKSTWADPEVNLVIPFYHRLASLHGNARELPRRSDWSQIAQGIDTMITRAVNSSVGIPELIQETESCFKSLGNTLKIR